MHNIFTGLIYLAVMLIFAIGLALLLTYAVNLQAKADCKQLADMPEYQRSLVPENEKEHCERYGVEI